MRKNDTMSRVRDDLHAAAALLTRLPLPSAPIRGARAAWAYPVIGAGTGLIAGLAGILAIWGGLPPPLAALISVTVQIKLTGAMHEDGVADTVDGFWGGWTRERRLEIMKDSSLGSYGAIALILTLAARWSALWLMFDADAEWALTAMVVAGAMSRAAMPALMWILPHARGTGLSHGTGRPSARGAASGAGIAAACALVLAGWAALPALIWAAVVTGGMAIVARQKIGGQTGDTLGAVQQFVEIAVLMSLLVN